MWSWGIELFVGDRSCRAIANVGVVRGFVGFLMLRQLRRRMLSVGLIEIEMGRLGMGGEFRRHERCHCECEL